MRGTRRRLTSRTSVLDAIDGAFFAFSAVSAAWFAVLLLIEGVRPGWQSILLVVFWVFVAYLLLPRLHRILTHIYLPGYFIGRARTSDGLLGDPVNVAWRGHEVQLHRAMETAGWVRADDLDFSAGRKIVTSTLRRRSYPRAPVSPLVLFDRQQDFAYEREVDGTPSQRHHVRFWRCPDGWMLPGGFAVDWLAAATYDKRVGLSLFTLQVTHKIDADTDVERDHVVSTVTSAEPRASVATIANFSTGYHSRNGGGDLIETDGDLPVVDVREVGVPPDAPVTPSDSRSRLPGPTVFGAGVAALRAIFYLAAVVVVVVSPDSLADSVSGAGETVSADDVRRVTAFAAPVLALLGLIDLGLAIGVLRGSNVARLVLMSVCVVATSTAFLTDVVGRAGITLAGVMTVGVNILVVLALSSHRARAYATRERPSVGRTRLPG
ncbi:hypothetical protein FE697_010060 [Mumia zhuanghuii]|uniref:LssY C-terminal domain-containing protein n=2 Tax=Mumia TaxID=1546255 RepID=A0ABW1QR61_9ACTN|nr:MULTISPECIES: LssY C-terminal domain-containing protein [Mumia]KAA1423889.1 hypothetical protein FE697_010060 [Mumia zhuanghuii]